MSRNLVKQRFAVVSPDDKRIIDTSELMQQRLEEYNRKQSQKEASSFVAGLKAEEINLPESEENSSQELEPSEMLKRAEKEAVRMLDEAKAEAERILAEAGAKAIDIQEEARNLAEVEKAKVYADAKQSGYNEGIQQAMLEGEAAKQEYMNKEREAIAYYQQQIDLLEPQLVDVITEIYEHIFHVELHSYREILSFLISSAIRKNDGGHEFIIHVSKEDYPYINMQKKQIIASAVAGSSTVEILEDITLSKNDCMIETENGIFDCGLGTQMAELKRRLQLLSWTKEE